MRAPKKELEVVSCHSCSRAGILHFRILFVQEPPRNLSPKTLHPDQCLYGSVDGGVNPTQSTTKRLGKSQLLQFSLGLNCKYERW